MAAVDQRGAAENGQGSSDAAVVQAARLVVNESSLNLLAIVRAIRQGNGTVDVAETRRLRAWGVSYLGSARITEDASWQVVYLLGLLSRRTPDHEPLLPDDAPLLAMAAQMIWNVAHSRPAESSPRLEDYVREVAARTVRQRRHTAPAGEYIRGLGATLRKIQRDAAVAELMRRGWQRASAERAVRRNGGVAPAAARPRGRTAKTSVATDVLQPESSVGEQSGS